MRRSERFTEGLLVVVIDGGMISSIAFRWVGLARSLLLLVPPHQYRAIIFFARLLKLVSCHHGPARLREWF